MNWHDIVTGVLNLVDLALTANLILIVIFSSYENFIRRIDAAAHPDWPEGLTQVDFGELKQKLLGSIVGIAAVDALAWYFDLEKFPTRPKLAWVLAFPLMFVAVMLMLAIADRLGGAQSRPGGLSAQLVRLLAPTDPAGEGLLTITGVNRTSALARTGSDCAYAGHPHSHAVFCRRHCGGGMRAAARAARPDGGRARKASTMWSMAGRRPAYGSGRRAGLCVAAVTRRSRRAAGLCRTARNAVAGSARSRLRRAILCTARPCAQPMQRPS